MTPPAMDIAACQEKLALLADLLTDLDRRGATPLRTTYVPTGIAAM